MSDFFSTIAGIWNLLFSWMPTPLAIACTIVIALVAIICILKIVALIFDFIPFT